MPRERFIYRPTELGQEVYDRGGLEEAELAVFIALEGEGVSPAGTPIDRIQDRLLASASYMVGSQFPDDPFYDEDRYKIDRYAQGKYIELAHPLKLRETIQSMVRKGLLKRI